jgi:hypothetical protein
MLEVVEQRGEGIELQEALAARRRVEGLVLHDPGMVVRDEDGVQAGGERRVDVRARRVADHPGGRGIEAVEGDEGSVGGGVLFGEHLDRGEERLQAGADEFVGLLDRVSLGDEQEAVTGREGAERGLDGGHQLDAGAGNGVGEGDDAGMALAPEFLGERVFTELLEAGNQGLAETGQTIAISGDRGVLAFIEALADLGWGVDAVVEVGDERGDGPLEVDVVLPEGVVGVEEQGLLSKHLKIIGFLRDEAALSSRLRQAKRRVSPLHVTKAST